MEDINPALIDEYLLSGYDETNCYIHRDLKATHHCITCNFRICTPFCSKDENEHAKHLILSIQEYEELKIQIRDNVGEIQLSEEIEKLIKELQHKYELMVPEESKSKESILQELKKRLGDENIENYCKSFIQAIYDGKIETDEKKTIDEINVAVEELLKNEPHKTENIIIGSQNEIELLKNKLLKYDADTLQQNCGNLVEVIKMLSLKDKAIVIKEKFPCFPKADEDDEIIHTAGLLAIINKDIDDKELLEVMKMVGKETLLVLCKIISRSIE